MTHKSKLDELRRQVESAAEMEATAWFSVTSNDRGSMIVSQIRESMRSRLVRVTKASKYADEVGFGEVRSVIRAELIDEINAASLFLINTALRGFQELCDARVDFLMNTSDDPNEPEWGKCPFLEFPFINGHREALESALLIRGETAPTQMRALQLAHCKRDLQDIAYSESAAANEGVTLNKRLVAEKAKLTRAQQLLISALSAQVVQAVNDFYRNMEIGSIHPYAIPIQISVAATSDDLRLVAEAFRRFGRDVRIPAYLSVEGNATQLRLANVALAKYHGAGLAFQMLSAWVMATDMIAERRQCSICYRHTSAIFRCVEHATKTQETREARLGKRVRPLYESHFTALAQVKRIKAVLTDSLWIPDSVNDEMQNAAECTGLSAPAKNRAIYLAKQLRVVLPILNNEMAQRIEQLFGAILAKAWEAERQPPPVGADQRGFIERQRESVSELLSLKGFLRAWCGTGRFSPEVSLTMLGFDRDHPVAKGCAIDGAIVQRTLLEQRAWEEAFAAFLSSAPPTAAQIEALLLAGHSKKLIAAEMGISLATVYNTLNRGGGPTKRNFLGAPVAQN
jgi:hypothetical protein